MFTIVEALKELDGAGVTELSDHLDLPKSAIHNYLATLEQEARFRDLKFYQPLDC